MSAPRPTMAEMAAAGATVAELPAAVATTESSTEAPTPGSSSSQAPRIDQLVLDAGPLLAQLPLRTMASKFYVPPMVMAELKDKKARDHLEFLKISGMDLEVREAGPEALAQVIAFAKQTGDYAVLSRPDLAVLALAYALEVERHGTWRIRDQLGGRTGQQKHETERLARQSGGGGGSSSSSSKDPIASSSSDQPQSSAYSQTNAPKDEITESSDTGAKPCSVDGNGDRVEAQNQTNGDLSEEGEGSQAAPADEDEDEQEIVRAIAELDLKARQPETQEQEGSSAEDVGQTHDDGDDDDEGWTQVASSSRRQQREEEDYGGSDGEGEWITSSTITKQKQKDLGLVTDEALSAMKGTQGSVGTGKKGKKGKKGSGKMTVATMTADYAVQNVLLQMGLALVSTEGMRIERVKSWVLRCHACFKICKDSERKFCPSCGNPTLLRTSVTSVAPGSKAAAGSNADGSGGMQVHLKKNFQYKSRGTIYSLPLPKPSSSSALKDPKKHAVPILREDQVEWQRGVAREQVKRNKEQRALDRALEKGKDTLSARYDDPDWIPSLLSGDSSKNRHDGLPSVGSGRRNPNQAKHGRRRK